ADWVHLAAATLWVGGLVQLVAVVWPGAPELRRTAFLRFSRLATVLVALLLGAGAYLSVQRPPHVRDLRATGYGHVLLVMPGYLPSAGLGCKLVTLFPHNAARPTHPAAIMLFDPENGTPLALMDGTHITATRTAAAAALAARLLAREDASVLAILGTGVQARSHARAFARIRDWSEIRVAGRDAAKARSLADELGVTAAGAF